MLSILSFTYIVNVRFSTISSSSFILFFIFSFVVSNYTFLAGAHGYNDYTNYNIDPVTGKEITVKKH